MTPRIPEYNRKWRLTHLEQTRKSAREYARRKRQTLTAEELDQLRAHRREWARQHYQKHKAERYAANERWRRAHPEWWRKYHRERARKFRAAMLPEVKAEYARIAKEWRMRNREHMRELYRRSRLRRYGITLEQYEKQLHAQAGVCAVCGNPPGDRSLAVDHNHHTNAVRGLLCSSCNILVGHARDSLHILHKLIEYLRAHDDD